MRKQREMIKPIITLSLLILLFLSVPIRAQSTGNIYLYGETHAVEKILKKEIEIWGEYYNTKGIRDLFIELPYYTAEFLNIWMNSDTDEILNKIYADWKGTSFYNLAVRDFYKEIKKRFPETVFHGTDVGHQFNTTGKRYLDYLSINNMEKSEQYQRAKEVIEQGKRYYSQSNDGLYREKMMVANFVCEFNKLNNKSIMGIYGSAHTGINSMDKSNSVPSMANQLHKIYSNQLFTKNLSYLAKEIDPFRTDIIRINSTEYEALFFGRQDLKGFKDYEYREFWRLEGAFNDFRNAPKTGNKLLYNNYPMNIVSSQVFVIDYMKTDSTLIREFHISDGNFYKNHPATEEITVE